MTNILTTIGPETESNESIRSLLKYTKLFRINGSHGNLNWHKKTIKKIRNLSSDAFILLDMPGIKPRTKNSNIIKIRSNEIVTFGKLKHKKSTKLIGLSKPLPHIKKNSKLFSINDSKFEFRLLTSSKDSITGISKSSFDLLQNQGLNIPNSSYNENLQYKIYKEFIKKIRKFNIDAIGLSFVQTSQLIKKIRNILPKIILISKIENYEGMKNYINIIDESDAIMIDRGDLAAEIGSYKLYNSIEDISKYTKEKGKPLIMATENLQSMEKNLQPSKSEIMSIAHSSSIGVDCIMLSEETAISKNFKNTVNWLYNFIKKIPNHPKIQINNTFFKYPELWSVLSNVPKLPIVIFSKTGYALFNGMSLNSEKNLYLFSKNNKINKISMLFRKKIKVIKENLNDNVDSKSLYKILRKHKKILFKNTDSIMVIYVSLQKKGARANTITFVKKNDLNF